MDDHVSHDKIAELKEAFALFDHNETGSITTEELRVIIASLMASDFNEEDFQRLLTEADVDSSGTVDFAEFVSLMVVAGNSGADDHGSTDGGTPARHHDSRAGVKEMVALFAAADPRGTSFVSKEQFTEVVRSGECGLSETEAAEMWDDAVRMQCVKREKLHYRKLVVKLLASADNRRLSTGVR